MNKRPDSQLKPLYIIEDMKELSGNPEAIERLFSNGYCYEFCLLLRHWYPSGKIFFVKDKQHYVFKKGDKYWDINGEYDCNEEELVEDDLTAKA